MQRDTAGIESLLRSGGLAEPGSSKGRFFASSSKKNAWRGSNARRLMTGQTRSRGQVRRRPVRLEECDSATRCESRPVTARPQLVRCAERALHRLPLNEQLGCDMDSTPTVRYQAADLFTSVGVERNHPDTGRSECAGRLGGPQVAAAARRRAGYPIGTSTWYEATDAPGRAGRAGSPRPAATPGVPRAHRQW